MLNTGLYYYNFYLLGDKKALEQMITVYSDALTRFAYCYIKDSHAAEDIMEEAFAALIVQRKRFANDEQLRAYLYKIVRNKSIDYLRRHKREAPPENAEELEEVLSSCNIEDSLLKQERNQIIYTCMQKLPAQYRETLYLAYFEDFPVKEICKLLKKNTKQVYNLLSRAKQALKELLETEGITYEDLS